MIKILEDATTLAIENRDVEALVAISDRWYALMESADHNSHEKIVVGFTNQENIDDQSKAKHKRKS